MPNGMVYTQRTLHTMDQSGLALVYTIHKSVQHLPHLGLKGQEKKKKNGTETRGSTVRVRLLF